MGSLMYVAIKTGPDIIAATIIIGTRVESQIHYDMMAAKRVLRYLKRTKRAQMILKPGADTQITAHADLIWRPGYELRRKSHTTIVIRYGEATVYTASKALKTIAFRSTEAAYAALSECASTMVWLRKVMNELNIGQSSTSVSQDNNGCIEWSKGGPAKHFNRRKHIKIKANCLTQLIKNEEIHLVKVNSNDMHADFHTKPLGSKDFHGEIRRANIRWFGDQ